MKIENGKQVKLEYSLTVEGIGVIESSESRGPLEYLHGENSLPLGLEGELDGLEEGSEKEGSFEVEVPSMDMSRKDFPEDFKFDEGAHFTAKKDGQDLEFTVVGVKGDVVKVIPVHPLAGKKIEYKVKVLEVSEPK
jgi:FKBP-type peptidyl-prolyl cis-trans isomerase SlyD